MCLFQVEGHTFPVLFKSYCLGCSRDSRSCPSLCSPVLSSALKEESGGGSSCGQLLWRFGRDHNFIGHPTCLGVTD